MTCAGQKKLFVKTYGCQMNVYDSERMTAALGAQGYCRRRSSARGRGSHPAQYLPHPREGGREGLFRARPAAPAEGAQSRSCGSASRAASPRRRARRSWRGRRWSISWSGRRPTTGCRRCIARRDAGERPVETEFPAGGQVRSPAAGPPRPARAGGVPDGAGGLRQVLRLLRGALYPRRRGFAAGGAGRGRSARAGGARRGGDHPARAERQRLSRRGRA